MPTDSTNITDKVVVITGASSGLGEATARYLAERGATVVLGARRVERLQASVDEITGEGGTALALATDVTDAAQVQALVDAAVERFGPVDVLLDNAGLMPHWPLERRKIEDWDRTIDVNITGVLYGVAAALPHMQRHRAGQIIDVIPKRASAPGGWAAQGAAAGRPADVLQLPDGSILISDDTGNRILRVSYRR